MLTRQSGQTSFNFTPYASNGDAKDALAALDEVNHFIRRRTFVDARAVAHQCDLRKVLNAPLAQVFNGSTDLLEGHAGVQKAFDDLEHKDVAETVEPLGA